MKTINYSKQALDFLGKLQRSEKYKIITKIEQYAESPDALKNQVKKLKGLPFYRLRVGDYRVVFDESGLILSIVKIGHRKNIYKELRQ